MRCDCDLMAMYGKSCDHVTGHHHTMGPLIFPIFGVFWGFEWVHYNFLLLSLIEGVWRAHTNNRKKTKPHRQIWGQ